MVGVAGAGPEVGRRGEKSLRLGGGGGSWDCEAEAWDEVEAEPEQNLVQGCRHGQVEPLNLRWAGSGVWTLWGGNDMRAGPRSGVIKVEPADRNALMPGMGLRLGTRLWWALRLGPRDKTESGDWRGQGLV